MQTLKFNDFSFLEGRNWTVRAGKKTFERGLVALVSNKTGEEMESAVVDMWIGRFADIPKYVLDREHDPSCRSKSGLLGVMRQIYGDKFGDDSVITAVCFSLPITKFTQRI